MRKWLAIGLILMACVNPTRAGEIDQLIEEVKQSPDERGISGKYQKIGERFQKIGPEANSKLLPLLRDERFGVRYVAAYILSDMPGLTEKDLPLLIESQRKECGWLPPTIARIGTPEAVAFLVDELVKIQRGADQVIFAMGVLGTKVVPNLLEIYESKTTKWDRDLESRMTAAFKAIGPNASAAIAPLTTMALDEDAPVKKRVRAINALEAIGKTASSALPDLITLKNARQKDVRKAAQRAIVTMGTSDAVPILWEQMRQSTGPRNQENTLIEIARLGPNGISAGPDIMPYLDNEDWDTRLTAIYALGEIGYTAAADALIKRLDNVEDWRVVKESAVALGKLQAASANEALRKVAASHWYPGVRQSAQQALIDIRRDGPARKKSDEWIPIGEPELDPFALSTEEAVNLKLSVAQKPNQLVTPYLARGSDALSSEPLYGIAVDNGFLTATDHGEWGGETKFIDLFGRSQTVIRKNTDALYHAKADVLAVTGLNHMGMNDGTVYRLRWEDGRGWVAVKWRALPGAPRFSRMLEDGTLFISCWGGMVSIHPDGRMKMVTRAEALGLN